MRYCNIILVASMILLFAGGCLRMIGATEMAMSKGMIIEAKHSNQMIRVEALSKLKRRFYFDDKKVVVEMWSRWKRWNGSRGAYCPGGKEVYTLINEGRQYFVSEDEAIDWMKCKEGRKTYIYSSNGIVLGWEIQHGKSSPKTILAVDIWQLCIKNKRPEKMKGARDDLISVQFKEADIIDYPEIGRFKPSQPKVINGCLYPGKAIDHMLEKDIKAEHVEEMIKYGEKREKSPFVIYSFTGLPDRSDNPLYWVSVDSKNRIVFFD